MVTLPVSSDGINFAKFDLNKWNGKKTDYGKRIQITTNTTSGGGWRIELMNN